jgi:two-component system NtrC family sensor kinase
VSDPNRLGHLVRAIALRARIGDLLPELHQHALRVAGGRCTVLTRWNPRTERLIGTSAAGLEQLDPDPWLRTSAERTAAERAWDVDTPLVFDNLTELNGRLGSRAAILVPLQAGEDRLGMFIVGTDDIAHAKRVTTDLAAVGDLLAIALERARLQRHADLQRDFRELLADVSRAVSSSIHLSASLEIFCNRARVLLSADRISVWLHDRRARSLDLIASSDAAEIEAGRRLPTDDASIPVTATMRRSRAELVTHGPDLPPDVLVPLKGRRRALGTLELTRLQMEGGDEIDLLDRIEEVARQLSSAIENVWLLEDVLRSRRELEGTFNSLADLVVVSDERLLITHANQAFSARVDRRPADLLEHPLAEFFGADLVEWVDRLRQPAEHGVDYESRELEDPLLGGTFVFTVSPLVGREDERIGTVIVARNVTDQAELEAERVELRNRLTQSEKLAALGQFVAGIAHELNNPLQGVLGHVELMLQSPAKVTARAKRDLKLVFREADRAAKIVHNLLVFAGSRRITRRRLNVNHVVTRVLSLRATACNAASIEVVKELAPKLPRIAGDALLLQQALLNIIVNAEQALATVEGPRRLEVRSHRRGRDFIEIQIADNGPGISAEALPRLFEPFFTTKEVGQGTGLGLAIAYGIVQEHDGRLLVTNRSEGGAMFTIELPSGSEAVE